MPARAEKGVRSALIRVRKCWKCLPADLLDHWGALLCSNHAKWVAEEALCRPKVSTAL